MNDETIYLARLHWVIFLPPLLLLIAAMSIGAYFPIFKEPSLILVLCSLIWFGMTWANYQFSSLSILKKQLILRTGFIVRNTTDFPMAKIESIDIRQSILGALLGYGLLIITGTGGTRYQINYVDQPLTCRRYIEQSMHAQV